MEKLLQLRVLQKDVESFRRIYILGQKEGLLEMRVSFYPLHTAVKVLSSGDHLQKSSFKVPKGGDVYCAKDILRIVVLTQITKTKERKLL